MNDEEKIKLVADILTGKKEYCQECERYHESVKHIFKDYCWFKVMTDLEDHRYDATAYISLKDIAAFSKELLRVTVGGVRK